MRHEFTEKQCPEIKWQHMTCALEEIIFNSQHKCPSLDSVTGMHTEIGFWKINRYRI